MLDLAGLFFKICDSTWSFCALLRKTSTRVRIGQIGEITIAQNWSAHSFTVGSVGKQDLLAVLMFEARESKRTLDERAS